MAIFPKRWDRRVLSFLSLDVREELFGELCEGWSSDVVLCCLFLVSEFGDVSPYVCSLYF